MGSGRSWLVLGRSAGLEHVVVLLAVLDDGGW